MAVLHVPYHLDEHLPDLDFPLEAAEVICADLPSGDTWARLAALYRLVAGAAASTALPFVICAAAGLAQGPTPR